MERHGGGRDCAERRLDFGKSQGPYDLRCDILRARRADAVGEARCRHLQLAESAGRRRHDALASSFFSPRAIERLESGHKAAWPVPKLFRIMKEGKLNRAIFEGEIINTPSMMCVEDVLEAMQWAKANGGQKGMIARTQANFKALSTWIERTPWIDFLASDPAARSPAFGGDETHRSGTHQTKQGQSICLLQKNGEHDREGKMPVTTSTHTATPLPASASGAAPQSKSMTSRPSPPGSIGLIRFAGQR